MRILVVEDEPTLSSQLVQALQQAGHTVETAADGATAQYLGEVEEFDAVVLDLGLPVRDGLTVLRAWREQGQVMPVMILTARGAWHEGGRHGCRRRRLSGQALPHGRADGPPARPAAPAARTPAPSGNAAPSCWTRAMPA